MELGTNLTYWKYSQLLDEFLAKYNRQTPDVTLFSHGPFWPRSDDEKFVVLDTPTLDRTAPNFQEPLYYYGNQAGHTVGTHCSISPYKSRTKWHRPLVVFDSEKNSPYHPTIPSSEEYGPSLKFESRFESGNLRQARRVGQFEYDLVLKSDLYTNRHTQWYFFRVETPVVGVSYKFRIVNLLKKDSLYNYGMRPLVYSEEEFKRNGIGWKRTGHHILYSRNMTNLQCPLLTRGTPYFMLEWQMEFPHTEGHYYLAHCYPYTFSDLKDDLDDIISQPGTSQWIKREVLCETRAGNSCFLITVTDFDCDDRNKEGVVLSARVHPGESQASWMMRGVLYFLTGSHPTAQELRKKFIFKIVPMLNPDGVIIGNYRCSLIGRDLNRNFRHPIKSSCPTVWYLKSMIEELSKKHQIMLYCDLHGHSRKHNVFMYGNNTSDKDNSALAKAKSFLNDRLFPWITALQAPDKFSFTSCKFRIRKCKESTGRVVMWRQLHIANSFTMEAAFSGSVLDRGQKPCHFNTRDYEDMGKSLCLAIYQFHRAQADRRLQAQLTISLTRQVTQQLRKNNNGAITSNGTVPQLKDFIRENRQNRKVKNNEHPTEVAQSASSTVRPDVKRDKREGEVIHDGSDGSSIPEPPPPPPPETATTATTTTQEMTSPFEDGIDDLLDADGDDELNEENGKPVDAMEGCLNLLLSLNATEVLMESDSSDSDSDTDSEIKSEPQKPPQRRRDSHKKRTRFSPPNNPKPLPPQKIPTTKETTRKTINVPPAVPKEEPKIPKYFPHFVSKYEGRTNGGIPCFSEERCIERTAAKRMVNMKETFEDQEQTDEHIEPEYQNLGFLPRYWSQLVAGSNSLKDILDPSSGSDEGDKKGVQFGDNPENSVPGLVVISENCKSNETTTDHNNPRQTSCVLKPQHRPLEQLNLPLKYRLLRTNKIEQNNFETISKPLRPP